MPESEPIEFHQSPTQKIVVDITHFGGGTRIDVRVFFRTDRNNPKWLATRKGVQLPIELAEPVAQAIADKADEARGRPRTP